MLYIDCTYSNMSAQVRIFFHFIQIKLMISATSSPKVLSELLLSFGNHVASTNRRLPTIHYPTACQTFQSMKFTTSVTCECGWKSDEQKQVGAQAQLIEHSLPTYKL